MGKTERLYQMQRMLSENNSVSMERFMEKLEVSRSTLKRDLEYLRDRLGAPIVWDSEQGGYTLEDKGGDAGTHSIPGLWLSEAEISGLLTSVDLLSALEPGPLIGQQIRPIRERLEKILELSSFQVSDVRKRIKLSPMGQRKTQAKHFQGIALAVLARKRLLIRHFGRLDAKTTEREVSPLRMVHYKDNWYLDAFCHLRDDLRSFAIDAIEQVDDTDKLAVSVDESVLARELDAGYGIFAGKDLKKAVLRFTPFRARWVANETWHPEQKGKMLPDGGFELELPYLDDRELLHDILKEGGEVAVVSPPELRVRVRDELQRAADRYLNAEA